MQTFHKIMFFIFDKSIKCLLERKHPTVNNNFFRVITEVLYVNLCKLQCECKEGFTFTVHKLKRWLRCLIDYLLCRKASKFRSFKLLYPIDSHHFILSSELNLEEH